MASGYGLTFGTRADVSRNVHQGRISQSQTTWAFHYDWRLEFLIETLKHWGTLQPSVKQQWWESESEVMALRGHGKWWTGAGEGVQLSRGLVHIRGQEGAGDWQEDQGGDSTGILRGSWATAKSVIYHSYSIPTFTCSHEFWAESKRIKEQTVQISFVLFGLLLHNRKSQWMTLFGCFPGTSKMYSRWSHNFLWEFIWPGNTLGSPRRNWKIVERWREGRLETSPWINRGKWTAGLINLVELIWSAVNLMHFWCRGVHFPLQFSNMNGCLLNNNVIIVI